MGKWAMNCSSPYCLLPIAYCLLVIRPPCNTAHPTKNAALATLDASSLGDGRYHLPYPAYPGVAMLTDIRLAFRRLRAGPVFAAGVIGTLALGLAAATSMYTVVDGVLLKPLPFSEPDRLVRIGADFTGRSLKDIGLSQPELEALARRSGAFSGISACGPSARTSSARTVRSVWRCSSPAPTTSRCSAPARRSAEPSPRPTNNPDRSADRDQRRVLAPGVWRVSFGDRTNAADRRRSL